MRTPSLALLLLLAAPLAHAQEPAPAAQADAPVAVVDAIWLPRPTGGWRTVDTSAQVLVDGRAVRVGDRLPAGTTLSTGEAQVRLRWARHEQIVLDQSTEVLVEDRGLWQRMGQALYQVRRAFTAREGQIEARVEGTRWVVRPGAVHVQRGTVLVGPATAPDQAQPVRHGQVLGTDPLAAAPAPATRADRTRLRSLGRRTAPPPLLLTVDLGASLYETAPQLVPRLGLRGTPVKGLGLYLDGGVSLGTDRFHVPVSAGLTWVAGRWELGGGPQLRIGSCTTCDPDLTTVKLRPGIEVLGRTTQPLSSRLALTVTARGGWADVFSLGASVGLGLGL